MFYLFLDLTRLFKNVTKFLTLDTSKTSVRIKRTRTASASVTKLNGNYISKRTTYSSFLGTAITSAKLSGSTLCFIKIIVSYFIHCIPCAILR